MKIRQTIDTSESDRMFVERFMHEVHMLAGMVKEMFVEEKVLLLSPIMRELIADKARLVADMRLTLQNHVCADNLGKDFSLPND